MNPIGIVLKGTDMLTKNELTLLNGLIYKIYATEDPRGMRESVLGDLKSLIGYDMATFELASPTQPYHVTDPVGVGTSRASMERYLREVQEYDYGRWTYAAPSGGVYRESDFMPDEKRVKTPYYRNFFKPEGVHFCVMLVIIRNREFLGVLALFRSRETGDFSSRDQFILSLLQDHLGFRLEAEKKKEGQVPSLLPDRQKLEERYGLTRRESEITELLLQGAGNPSICGRCGIAPTTLKKHISNIYRKTGIRSARELIQMIVPPEKAGEK